MKTQLAAPFAGLLALMCAPCAYPQGTAFMYHGQLNDNGRAATGAYDLRFLLYDSAATLGAVVAGPFTNSATSVSNGLFAVTVDFGASAFTGTPRWLEIAVRTNGDSAFVTMGPRQPVLAVPYAIVANAANTLFGAVPAAQLSGILPDALLSTNIPRLNNDVLSGDGSGLTNLKNLPTPGWIWRQMPVPGLMLSTYPAQGCNNSESLVVTNILISKTNGMWGAGWRTVLIEDGQYAAVRDSIGNLVADPVLFPHGFPFLVNVAHTNEFRIGGYSSGGYGSCCPQHDPGTPPDLLAQHIRQHVEWGFDGMTIDCCGLVNTVPRVLNVMRVFNQVAFDDGSSYISGITNRGMFLILNQNDGAGGLAPWESIYDVNCIGLNTVAPGQYSQADALAIGRECLSRSYLIGPGHYLDPTSFNPEAAPSTLTQMLDVYYMTASPIQIPLQNYSAEALSLLTNREALAIDQDSAVITCTISYSNMLAEVWTRPLGGINTGSNAVLIINESTTNQTTTVTAAMLGQPATTELTLRDPWMHTTVSNFTGSFSYTVAPTNMVLLTTFNPFPIQGSQYASALWMQTNSAPVDPGTVRVWFNVTNKSDGQIYKIPGYQ